MPHDTAEIEVAKKTLHISPGEQLPAGMVPTSLRAPPPANQVWSDEYVFNLEGRGHESVQSMMPLYLSEELSPRFSRAKQTRGWNERRALERALRAGVQHEALAEWEAGGRDAGLGEVLGLDIAGLEGVPIRARTRKEIRDAVAAEFDDEVAAARAGTARARAAGQLWDAQAGEWAEGPQGTNLERKRSRKDRKARKIIERLERLSLQDAPNQVVPKDLRGE